MIDMSTASPELLRALAALNALIDLAISYSCWCRIAKMSRETTLKRFRFNYSLLTAAAFASAGSPWFFGEWPGPALLLLSAAVLAFLGVGYRNWAEGPPDYARSSPVPLDEAVPLKGHR